MTIYQDAVKLATTNGKWQKHPYQKRTEQVIQLVADLSPLWESDEPEKDVPINACVYLYFQIYKNLDEGKTYVGKSLPVVAKNYKETRSKSVIIYVG